MKHSERIEIGILRIRIHSGNMFGEDMISDNSSLSNQLSRNQGNK